MEITELFFTTPNPIHAYGLVFLLGSLTVSSLSDLRRMAAQADFAEVWAAYAVFMFTVDVYLGMTAQLQLLPFILKWLLILIFAAAATGTHLMQISTMDTAAEIALLSTLNPAYIILALLLTLLVNELIKPILSKYGEGGAYPFLPTILAVNLLILITILAGGIETHLGQIF